jgi:small acid-soluble spore protein H (minor)
MDVTRAQEILRSKDKIGVQHDGEQVWIDSIDENSKTARIHAENSPENLKTVAVTELREVH